MLFVSAVVKDSLRATKFDIRTYIKTPYRQQYGRNNFTCVTRFYRRKMGKRYRREDRNIQLRVGKKMWKNIQDDQKVSMHLMITVYSNNSHTIDDLKKAITEYIRNADRAILNTVFENTVRRVNKCLETSSVPRIFFGGGSKNSVEYRGQIKRGSGGGSPLVRGSTQFANEWNPYSH
jgi:hypothetical protein